VVEASPIEARARALFEAHNPHPGRALAHHNLRIAAFARQLGAARRLELDVDLLQAACWLHDVGLLIPDRAEPLYLQRSWAFVEPHARAWGLSAGDRERLRQVLVYNHSLRPIGCLDPMAELVRRAVQVEHSRGWLDHGLGRGFCRQVFSDLPRLDLTRILVDFARITLFEDGVRQLPGIFWPRF
jgi:hypothetical protein